MRDQRPGHSVLILFLSVLILLSLCIPALAGPDPCLKDGTESKAAPGKERPCKQDEKEIQPTDKRAPGVPEKEDPKEAGIAEEQEKNSPEDKGAADEKESAPDSTQDIFERLMADDPSLVALRPLKPFGESFFSGSGLAPAENLPPPPDYPVGPGDEIGVTFWGRVSGEYTLKVSRDGTISLPMIGTINVNGLTYKEVSGLVSRKAREIVGAEVSVTMGRLRSIQVFVLGEVKRPGAFKLSAVSTVSNALMAAGGAAPIGSLRKVELRRSGDKTRQVDFYDLLLKGDKTGDSRLKDGDVVFVPVAAAVIGVAGNVKRPALYETKAGYSLSDGLELSGGVIPTAYTQQVQVERIEGNSKRVVVDINAGDGTAASNFILKDGDLIKVMPITGDDTNAVYLYGNVKRPGKYELKPDMKVSQLITGVSDLLEETHLTYAVVKRLTPQLTTMVIPFDIGAMLKGSLKDDIELMPLDSVFVFSTWLFLERPIVTIEGEVRNPGRFTLEENMTVRDLVLMAGGLATDASYGEYELYSTDSPTQKTILTRLNLGKALQGLPSDNPVLHPSDLVRVHSVLETEPKKTVAIHGMVNSPGEYAYASGMKVSDLVFAGGGPKESAYLREAELASYAVEDKTTSTLNYTAIDLEKALSNDASHDLVLKPHDSLFVREMVGWHAKQSVELGGEVKFPGKYVFKRGERLSSVIKRAGGYTAEAYLRGAVFTREAVRKAQQSSIEESVRRLEARLLSDTSGKALSSTSTDDPKLLESALSMKKELLAKLKDAKALGRISLKLTEGPGFTGTSHDIELENDDRLFVPSRPNQVQIIGAVQNPAAFVFEQEATLKSYINMSGGFNSEADSERVYILKSDGTALSKGSSWTGFGYMSTKLEPGDTIVVPERIDKGLLMREVKDITQILYQIAVTAGVLIVAF